MSPGTKCLANSADHLYICGVCQKVQTSVTEMRHHMKTHRTFECEMCLRTFKGKHLLKNHLKTHNRKSEYECPLCRKTFLHVRYLDQHMKTHSAVKKFVCEVCKKQFTQLIHLKSHVATHMTRKPFSCKLCNKEFSCKGSLLRHCQVHAEDEPFTCKLCNKRFSRKDSLLVHNKVVHQVRKKVQCITCDLEFTDRADLKNHQEKMHVRTENPQSKIKTGTTNICILERPKVPEIKVTFSVSILRTENKVNNSDPIESDENAIDNKSQETVQHSVPCLTDQELISHDQTSASTNYSEEIADEWNDPLSPSDNPVSIPDVLAESSCSVSVPEKHEFDDAILKRDNSSDALALFSDCDVCEISNLTPTNLTSDFLLDSLGDWPGECSLAREPLPICSMDHELTTLELSHELASNNFLNVVSDDYFSSLQYSMPFTDLQTE